MDLSTRLVSRLKTKLEKEKRYLDESQINYLKGLLPRAQVREMIGCDRDEWPEVEKGAQLLKDLIDCFKKPVKPKPKKKTKKVKKDKVKTAQDKLRLDASKHIDYLMHVHWEVCTDDDLKKYFPEPPEGKFNPEAYDEWIYSISNDIRKAKDTAIARNRTTFNPAVNTIKNIRPPVRLTGYRRGDFEKKNNTLPFHFQSGGYVEEEEPEE